MKASVGILALIGVLLSAGSVLAQVAPHPRGGASPATAPRTNTPPTPDGASGSENGETRATVNQSGAVIAAETSAPVNGVGGTGGGRFTFVPISRLNTVQACAARGGDIVMHEGVQQCRLPATPRREETNSAMGEVSTTR